jgi:methyl-accepting chemotaxis protein
MQSGPVVKDTAKQLEIGAGRVAALNDSCDQLFAFLDQRIPDIDREIRALASGLEQIMGRGADNRLSSAIRSCRHLTDELLEVVSKTVEDSASIGPLISACDEQVKDLGLAMGQIRKLSKEIRLTAINATITAANCGTDGLGFGVLTKALGEIARAFQEGVTAFSALSERLALDLGRLSSLQLETSALLNQSFSGSGTSSVFVDSMGEIVETARNLAGELTAPVSRLLDGLRRASHLREALGHVRQVTSAAQEVVIGFRALDVEGTPARDQLESAYRGLHFLDTAGPLTDELMETTVNEAQSLLVDLRTRLQLVANMAKHTGEIGARYAAGWAKTSGDFSPAQIGAVGSNNARLQHYGEILGALDQTAYQFMAAMRPIEHCTMELRAVNSLMKIETSRVSTLASARSITDTINRAIENFVTFVVDVREKIASITVGISSATGLIGKLIKGLTRRPARISAQLAQQANVARAVLPQLDRAVEELTARADRVQATVKETLSQLDRLEDELPQGTRLEVLRQVASWAHEEKDDLATKHALSPDVSNGDGRLEHLIDRFTDLAADRRHAEYGNLDALAG